MTYEEIIQFHGHECPGLAIGYRMAIAAMENLESFRAEDEELVAIVENDACGVDALQCVTGCTFGKGNLLFRQQLHQKPACVPCFEKRQKFNQNGLAGIDNSR